MPDEDVILDNEDSTQDADTQAEVDWQKRYTDTQAEYTRSQQALKDAQSVWEDEQALLSRISEKYPHLIADEETADEDDFDDDSSEPESLTKAEFKAWQEEQTAQRAAEKAQERFEADFNRFVGDRELDQYGNAALRAGQYKDPDELEAAINGYFDYVESLGSKSRKKKAPHVLPGGTTATGVPDYSDMTRDQVNDQMVERARALESQS